MRILLALFTLGAPHASAFLPRNHYAQPLRVSAKATTPTTLKALQQEERKDVNDEIMKMKKEAKRMRLEAEKDETALTLKKIEAVEAKLNSKSWLVKNPDQEADLKAQLQLLNDRLLGKVNPPIPKIIPSIKKEEAKDTPSKPTAETASRISNFSSVKELSPRSAKSLVSPRTGFDDKDLDLYIPVAKEIDGRIPDATSAEKLEAFRSAPELQEHFQQKVQEMLVGPLEEMQELEMLKVRYLDSSSTKEREILKREIDKLEESSNDNSAFLYSDSVHMSNLPPLTEEELNARLEAVGVLPDTLIALYKQRNGLDEDGDLRLAVEIDYFEPQTQLLEQIRFIKPVPDQMREEFIMGYNMLPQSVRDHFAKNQGLKGGNDAVEVLKQVEKSEGNLSPLMQIVEASNAQPELPEYNDIEFVDRSRYLEEFYPTIADMEGFHPEEDDVQLFASTILDKKSFMVTSKLERVAGGYYIRGVNQFEDEEDGSKTASDKLVEKITEKLASSPLFDKLEFFYVFDPSPPTDEELEFGKVNEPIIIITAKNREDFYSLASPLTKGGVSFFGVLSTLLFAIGSCAFNTAIAERFTATLDQADVSGVLDLQWLISIVVPIFLSIGAIQISHELAHRVVAWKDKFEIGLPNLIPSITTGLTGAITPLKSPPPNLRSLFDFGVAGPLAGLALSFFFLLNGLELTASGNVSGLLPVIPVDILRTSSLGGGLVEFFLGGNILMPGQPPGAVVQLHPFAVAGFIGCITNSLALLPLGNTDGGRISVAMFGRRGAYVVKTFTTLVLCLAGLFGADQANIFLFYILFATIWQRSLETPVRNEVDELDFPRGLVGITTAIFVGLVLIPMM